MIEALGVPHTEIDMILVNGASVDFSYIVQDGDRVSVYPMFESFDIAPLVRLRPKPLRDPRFVLDTHLGKLASYMRMVGFDTLYRNNYEDSELARISHEDRRTLLTKDRGLLKRSMVTHGYCVRETNPRRQLVEVLRRFDLFRLIEPFRRCIRCNDRIAPVDKAAVLARLSADTCQYYEDFWQCQSCGQVYWRGSHYQHMQQFIDDVIKAEFDPGE
jgi:hypothetical protein